MEKSVKPLFLLFLHFFYKNSYKPETQANNFIILAKTQQHDIISENLHKIL